MLRQALNPTVVRHLRRLHDPGIVDTTQQIGLDAERLKQDRIAALIGVEVTGSHATQFGQAALIPIRHPQIRVPTLCGEV